MRHGGGRRNSTLAATLVASKLRRPTAHVEAGLRSFDRTMPEEINRLVTDALADLLLAPEPGRRTTNLQREGVPAERIHLVGNVMIDTLLANLERARGAHAPRRIGVEPRRYVYVTLHRPSNVDERTSLEAIVACLLEVSRRAQVGLPRPPADASAAHRFRAAGEADGRGRSQARRAGGLSRQHRPRRGRWVRAHRLRGAPAGDHVLARALLDATAEHRAPDHDQRGLEPPHDAREAPQRPRRRSDAAGVGRFVALPRLWDGKASERIADALLDR